MQMQIHIPDSASPRGAEPWSYATPDLHLSIRLSAAETDGRYALVEAVAQPGYSPPLHIHAHEDEHCVVLDGTVRFVCGRRLFDVMAGEVVTIPKGVQHTWGNVSDAPVRLLNMYTPGGFEQCLRYLGGLPTSEIEKIWEIHGFSVVGPPIAGS